MKTSAVVVVVNRFVGLTMHHSFRMVGRRTIDWVDSGWKFHHDGYTPSGSNLEVLGVLVM